jgi:tRNA modification GTPase
VNLALEDTIAAIATPPGRGGIGVLRLSGRDALEIARRLFVSPGGKTGGGESWNPLPRQVHLGRLCSPRDGRILDQACLTYFPAPHSYTREHVVELSCHGSPRLLEMILDLLVDAGARPAEPGEFTYRAYLGGRIDITRGEAIQDLIEAATEREVEIAAAQLQGGLHALVGRITRQLTDIVADTEAGVEFVDEAENFPDRRLIAERLAGLEKMVRETVESYRQGRRIREGIPVALMGRANVGKSTLFNSLIGSSRAIVTAEPGTTRDVIDETVEIEGRRVRLLDTAGLREAESEAERLGIEKTLAEAEGAELVVFVLDLSRPISPEEIASLASLDSERVIPVLNKSDLEGNGFSENDLPKGFAGSALKVSALHGDGLDALRAEIVSRACDREGPMPGSVIVTRLRQRDLLNQAADHLARCREAAGTGTPEEFLLEDLHASLRSLGQITGTVTIETVYDRIFSQFCIGK